MKLPLLAKPATRSTSSPEAVFETAHSLCGNELLHIEEAIKRAIQWNLGRTSLEPQTKWIKARQRRLNAGRQPQVRFDVGENDDITRTRYGLRAYPSTPWSKRSAHHRTEFLVRFAETQLRAEEHKLAMRIRNIYAKLYQQKRRSEHIRRISDIRLQQFNSTRTLVAEGQGLASDQMQARLDLLDATYKLNQLDHERLRMRYELATLLGLKEDLADEDLALAASIQTLIPTVHQLEELIKLAYEFRPDLAAVILRERIANVDVSAARQLRIPWLSHIQGTIEDENSNSHNTWSIQMALNIPIGQEIGTRIAAGKAEREHYTSQMKKVKRHIANEIRLSLLAVKACNANVARSKTQQKPLLQKMLDALGDEDIGEMMQADLRTELHYKILQVDGNHIKAIEFHEEALLHLMNVIGNAVP